MTSRVNLPLDGTTRLFSVPFPFLHRSHVTILVNGILQQSPLNFDWVSDTSIEFFQAPSGTLTFARKTPVDGPLVRFRNGAQLTESELNTAVLQALYAVEEVRDYYDALVDGSLDKIRSGTGTEAGTVIDTVTGEILNSALLADLNARIADIDLNAMTINEQGMRLQDLAEVDGVPLKTIVANDRQARIDGDTAIVNDLSLIGAKSADALAWVLDLAKVKVSPTESLGQRLSALQASIDTNKAAITNEQTVRADKDTALASDISTLTTTVNGNTASIQTHQQTIDGIAAQYMVKTDVNGHVAGFGLYNAAGTSQFIINVDKFALAVPGTTIVPFAADANGVYMNNAYIRNLTVDKISGGAISSQWNLNSTSGRIVLDTGTYMKVIGVGFGTNADLIEWFGPKMAISSCTKANAVTYVGMDGSAYFGGSLRAGTLYNARTSTTSQVPNDCPLGPFATNGNPKSVVLSYSFDTGYAQTKHGSTGFTATGDCYADVELHRKIGTGPWTLIQSARFVGSYQVFNEMDAQDSWSAQISGSFTYTDSDPSTADREFIARVVQRVIPTVTHNDPEPMFTAATDSQRLSVVSTEE